MVVKKISEIEVPYYYPHRFGVGNSDRAWQGWLVAALWYLGTQLGQLEGCKLETFGGLFTHMPGN